MGSLLPMPFYPMIRIGPATPKSTARRYATGLRRFVT